MFDSFNTASCCAETCQKIVCGRIAVVEHVWLNKFLSTVDIVGSFKVRGILNQLRHFRRHDSMLTERRLVTMSSGNYGKAFAYLTSDFQHRLVLIPTTAPDDRQTVIEVCLYNILSQTWISDL